MENKSVVILGGGLWGGLLAYRLAEVLPGVDFQLYEKDSFLGGNHTWAFYESELTPETMKWVRPLIERSWGDYHSMTSRKFHEVLVEKLGSRLKLNNELPLDIAVQEATFVIDTRNECRFKAGGFQKFVAFELELESAHLLTEPILLDADVEQKDGYRFVNFLPWGPTKMIVKDTRYSHVDSFDLDVIKKELNDVIEKRGWKIKTIIREESGVKRIPTSAPHYREEGRVISLAGIFHDTTGETFPDAVRLVDQMTMSSFRFGELRRIVRSFRSEREKSRKFFRLVNKVMFSRRFTRIAPLIQRFHRGELQLFDKPRILLLSKL